MKIQQHEKEIDIENAIMEYLQRKGYLVFKHKRAGTWDTKKEIFREDKNPLHDDGKGMADLQLIIKPHKDCLCDPQIGRDTTDCCNEYYPHIFLEVKTKIGKQFTAQKEFQKRVENHGCLYYIVRSIDDVEKILKELL